MQLHSLLAVSLFAAGVCGQTTTPVVAPHVLVETVGPDGWRMRLGPTNVGSLLESEKGRALWQRGVLPVLGFWQQMIGDDVAFAASKARVLGYSGRIRVGLWVEEGEAHRQEWAHAAFVFEGDGRTDLAALAKDLRLLQTSLGGGDWSEVDVGGTRVELCTKGDGVMTAPLAESNCLLVALANKDRIATVLPRARAFAGTSTGKAPPPNSQALRIQIDLETLIAMALKTSRDEEATMMKALGLPSLGICELSIATAGPHVRLDITEQFLADVDRGLFGAFLPGTAGVPSLRQIVPAVPGSWKVGHLDFLALYLTIEKAVAEMNKGTTAEVRADVKKELGIDIVDDLLKHLTDDVLLISSQWVQLDRPEDVTWTLAVRLRDEAAFGKGLTAMLGKAKPFLTREATQKIGEVEVHRYGSMFGYDVSMCAGNGVFLVSGGRDAEQQLTALLAAAKTMPATADAKNSGFDDLQRHLPQGCNGLGTGDIGSIVAIPGRWWLMLLDEFTPLPGMKAPAEDDAEQRDTIRELLRQHHLDTMRSASGFAERTWRWRLYW